MHDIRKRYGVPAKRGGRVRYNDMGVPKLGTITGSRCGMYLRIRLDHLKCSTIFHPTSDLEYLEQPTRNALICAARGCDGCEICKPKQVTE